MRAYCCVAGAVEIKGSAHLALKMNDHDPHASHEPPGDAGAAHAGHGPHPLRDARV